MRYYAWSQRKRKAVCPICGRTFVTSSRVRKYCHSRDCDIVLEAGRKARKEARRKARNARKVSK